MKSFLEVIVFYPSQISAEWRVKLWGNYDIIRGDCVKNRISVSIFNRKFYYRKSSSNRKICLNGWVSGKISLGNIKLTGDFSKALGWDAFLGKIAGPRNKSRTVLMLIPIRRFCLCLDLT